VPVQGTPPNHPDDAPDPRGAVDPVEPPGGTHTPAALRPAARTRVSAAWVGICLGALVLVALIIFMLQNTVPVEVAFLGMRATAPLAVTLLIAGVGVGVVALIVGSLRIGQLRRRLGADRKAARPTGTTTP
jgi:putative membrane protein